MEVNMSLKEKIQNITSLTINEAFDLDITKCGVGGKLWKSCVSLASFLMSDNHKKYISFENKKVLEIGAGAGVCGFTAALLSPEKVTITDRMIGLLELLEKNLESNKTKFSENLIQIKSLDWSCEQELSNFLDYDIIIGSDLLYSQSMVEGLIKALNTLSNQNTFVLICLANRGYEDGEYDLFLKKLREARWKIDIIPENEVPENYFNVIILFLKKT
jgi:predicted nicotinamide N-methyase